METVVAAVRCRPLTAWERDPIIKISSENNSVLVSGQFERQFAFNYAFNHEATQAKIFKDLVNPVVEKVMNGFNACVMAYGQTGSGKTYTMGLADAQSPGVLQNALKKVFSSDCKIHVSFLEVYKEEVLDLLSPVKKKMPVVDFKPVGLTLVQAANVEMALSVMEKGLGNRHVGATNANLHSSRSHAVFTIHYTKTTEDGSCSSKLYLVDLAGSESTSDMSGDTRREGLMINKGLLQLGIVISALSSPGQDHVPYRNSALTAILKDTLSPQNFIVLIACISPVAKDETMTLNSLQFASRVGRIKANPEAGLIIKPRMPVTTPFKMPFKKNFSTINSTIATPGSHGKVKRPVLRPFNKTFDSPRSSTSRVQDGRKQYWPTSTPMAQMSCKPLFADPTPIPKYGRAGKRRSSSEWDALDISTSTVLEGTTTQVKAKMEMNQTALIQNPENETWIRSIIADTIREELKSLTFLSHTMKQDGPSPPKQLRRSVRLSHASQDYPSFFEHQEATTIVSSSPSKQDENYGSPKPSEKKGPVRRSMRLSTMHPRLSVSQNVSTCTPQKISEPASVRRSTRLSVAPQLVSLPGKWERTLNLTDSEENSSMSVRKQTKKAARLSTRFSMLPKTTPENAQKQINNMVLDILRSGNVRKLQSLPTVGPKTAVIISNHRLIHGPIESFDDLGKVRGLSAKFSKRFLMANSIVLDDSFED